MENHEEKIEFLTKNEVVRTIQLKNQKTISYILGLSSIFLGSLIILLVKQRISRRKTLSLLKSEKKRSEESEALYSGIFNNSTIGLYQTTPSGELLSANNAIIKMLKFDTEIYLDPSLSKKVLESIRDQKRIDYNTLEISYLKKRIQNLKKFSLQNRIGPWNYMADKQMIKFNEVKLI